MSIIQKSEDNGDFLCAEDGFWVYWPVNPRGFLTAWNLRVIARELDRRNAALHDEIEQQGY
jgi:hypothetical protein